VIIPEWLLWLAGTLGALWLASAVGRRKSDYDLGSPFLGLAVLLIWAAFVVGFWLAR